MQSRLDGKKILLGVCGSIAAFKACEFVRSLRKLGADVTVVLTSGGERFVSSLSFAALSAHKVYGGMFDGTESHHIPHINLSREHDLILIAPATAQTISRLAHGNADDLLSAIVLAATIPVVVCPAMNTKMYTHPATQRNLQTLHGFGYTVVTPDAGTMACDEEGPGRLPPWDDICFHLTTCFTPQDLAGKKLLVTAGPTEEPLDPVRFISNNSSGKMGYAIAEMASMRGADVTLVSGPTNLKSPHIEDFVSVRTAIEMQEKVHSYFDDTDILIMVAAVSDFRPLVCAQQKIKKKSESLCLDLAANDDILMSLKPVKNKQIVVGFAAESENHLEYGLGKLQRKDLELIVINDIKGSENGFKSDTNAVTILHQSGATVDVPMASKSDVAMAILDEVRCVVEGRDDVL